jgi:hypothetical protein
MRFISYIIMVSLFAFNASAEMPVLEVKNRDVSVKEIIVKEGERVEFKVISSDKDFYEVFSKELDLVIEVPFQSEVTVSLAPLPVGVYTYLIEFKHPEVRSRDHFIIPCKIKVIK